MPNWTKEQKEAIDTENSNIIVSAGAGSGKTAVLSERVLRKLQEGIDVDKLLVLTFTNAAALEMKIRIRKKIKQEGLTNQLNKLDSAYITTFDSFALSIVKKYSDVLNISRNVSIIDSSIILLEKKKILDDIFNNKYLSNDESFLKLIKDFCIKDDNQIKEYILSINNKIDMKYDKDIYLKNYLSQKYNEDYINQALTKYLDIINFKKDKLEELLDELQDFLEPEEYEKYYNPIINFTSAKDYDKMRQTLPEDLPRVSPKYEDEAKKVIADMKTIIKEIIPLFSYQSKEEIKETLLSTFDYSKSIVNIIQELGRRIDQYKQEKNVYEFVDISKMAIFLVKEHQEIREELKYYFNEIMIDEYQDTNDLQEEFIKEIENNNLYMVGDVKQSIYRFRNANPNIFKNKYDNYSNNLGGIKIDLNKNFRSRDEVLNNINIIFDFIMDDNLGGANYRSTHRMVYGNNSYKEEGNTTQNYNFELYNYEFDKEKEFTKEEIEAFIVAQDIKEKINNKYQIFDKDNRVLKDIDYNDFVIIMDRGSSFNLYKQIFEFAKIPLTIINDEDLTEQTIILIINNLIKLLIKIKENNIDDEFKYSFLSIARSYLYEYSDQYIFDIVTNKNYKETTIYQDLLEISKQIDELSINETLNLIIKKINMYEKLIKIGNINANIVCIEKILDFASNVTALGYDLNMFSEYLIEMLSSKEKIKYSLNTEDNNSVKIMNIHKSKGLEFHICYFTGLYKGFNFDDLKDKFLFDNEIGIITPYFKDGVGTTIYKDLLKEKFRKEEVSEKIRLFYVALTRAMEKMILVAPTLETEEIIKENNLVNENTRTSYKSFLDILQSIMPDITEYINHLNLDDYEMSKSYDNLKLANINIDSTDEIITTNELHIEEQVIKEESFSKKENKLLEKQTNVNMDFGTHIHYLLEILDLKKKTIDLEVDDFIKTKLLKFLNCDLLKNINDAKIIKEYEFIYEEESNKKHGIIDLILEYDDHIDIIDYKLKNTEDSNYNKQLIGYKKYIENKTNKTTNIYLYSIIDETINQITM